MPGQKTTSGLLPKAAAPTGAPQTRKVDASPLAPAHGMKDVNANPAKAPDNNRQPVAQHRK